MALQRHKRLQLVLAMFALGIFAAPAAGKPREVNVRRLQSAGLRVLDGRHVRIVTDLPSSPAVDELPAVFDAAVPQWADYFDVPSERLRDARWLGFVVEDRGKLAALDLLPAERPDFPTGFARDWEFWLLEQPSDYYRRHLLLHEGTHAFMQTQLGGAGPGWYMEGLAELLGTHAWDGRRLELGVMPPDNDDVPMWGRIALVREAAAENRPWPIGKVLAVDNRQLMSTEQYAWTWALASLLEEHPQFHDRFRQMQSEVRSQRFNAHFRAMFSDDWNDLVSEWEAFVAALDYGYDIARAAMVHRKSAPIVAAPRRVDVAADRGWQSTGWLLRAGDTYRLGASGRYQLDRGDEIWPCEPGGVTIKYHSGFPTGALVGALRPLAPASGGGSDPTFADPMLIGLGAELSPQHDGVLYVRINDDVAHLAGNAGQLEVQIERPDSHQ